MGRPFLFNIVVVSQVSFKTKIVEAKPLPRITPNMRLALSKAVIVMVPTYSVAWLTDKMVYVVPTLAAVSFLAAAIGAEDLNRLIDEGGEGDDADAAESGDPEDGPDGSD